MASHPILKLTRDTCVPENILDQTEEMRNRIVEANFKWKQAQMMIDYAYKQLEYAVNKWSGLQNVDNGLVKI